MYGQTRSAHPHHRRRVAAPLACTPLDLDFLLDHPLAHLHDLGQRNHDRAFLQGVADRIRPQIAALPTVTPQVGYCHGDAGTNNAHVDAAGQVTLFDFDFCGLGWRAVIPATCLSGESTAVTDASAARLSDRALAHRRRANGPPLFQIAQSIWLLGTRASYINESGRNSFTDRFVTMFWTISEPPLRQ